MRLRADAGRRSWVVDVGDFSPRVATWMTRAAQSSAGGVPCLRLCPGVGGYASDGSRPSLRSNTTKTTNTIA